MNNGAKLLKKILFLAIYVSCCYCFNTCVANATSREMYLKETYNNKNNDIKIKDDFKEDLDENVEEKVEEVVEYKNKKYRRKEDRKRADWNDWHGLKNKKKIKNKQRYSKDEILDNELKHYERTRQNLLNAYQRKNYDKKRQRRMEKYDTQIEFQTNEKNKKDDDIKKANEKYLKYKDNIRKIEQKYKNGEYTKVIITNANNVVNDRKDNDDHSDKKDDIDEKEEE